LKEYVHIARVNVTVLNMDEFYSHYYYNGYSVDPVCSGADDDTNWPKTVYSSLYCWKMKKYGSSKEEDLIAML